MKNVIPLKKENTFQKTAEEFFRTWIKLIQAVKLHKENNSVLQESLSDFASLADTLRQENDTLQIGFQHNRILIQNEKMTQRRENVRFSQSAFQYFTGLGFAAFHFDLDQYAAAETADFREALSLARLFVEAEQTRTPAGWFHEKLSEMPSPWLRVTLPVEEETDRQVLEKKDEARRSYAYALDSIQEITEKLAAQRRVGIGKTVRVAQEMVDLILDDDPLFMILSTLRTYDDYTYHHSVNVAILSMCLGKQIGLSKRSLERLGICGMLHDLGKQEIPLEILNKPGKLTDDEFDVIKRHTLDSAKLILRLRASMDRKARLILPPYEHHQKYDMSGYPASRRKKSVSFFGRILTLADVYDAITSPRVYRKSAMSPDQALGIMLKGMGTDFDPILLKVFINMLGVYPVGTLLLLDTGEMGLVLEKNGEGNRPRIVHLIPDGNRNYQRGKEIDMTERDTRTGEYIRNIVRSFHPSTFGIQPADYLF